MNKKNQIAGFHLKALHFFIQIFHSSLNRKTIMVSSFSKSSSFERTVIVYNIYVCKYTFLEGNFLRIEGKINS